MNINPVELYSTCVACATGASAVVHLLFNKKGNNMSTPSDGNVLMGVAPPVAANTTTPVTSVPADAPVKPDSDITDFLATLPTELGAITDDFKSKVSDYVTSAVTAASAVASGVQTDLTSSEVRDMVATGQKVVAFLEALGK